MVIHEPGDWLGESLSALNGQDYPELQRLILVTGTDQDPTARAILDAIETHCPGAVVRFLGSNPGFGASCNAVLGLVQGENGLFCLLHDDVVMAPGAITEMVVELNRSNAGLVGPKLVFWDDPSMIQSVGGDSDRFGVVLSRADVGEKDQEQHDAVQDVFVLSSACMLVRADLFRTLGGFTTGLSPSVSDLDFCWRVHLSGARSVIVPAAVARHRESTLSRMATEGLDPVDADSESDRVATVATMTSLRHLPFVLMQLLVLTLVRSMLLLLTGRTRRALVELSGMLRAPAATGSIVRARAKVRPLRLVDDADVRSLQVRGSAHVAAFLRRRAREAGLAQSGALDDVVESRPKSSYVLWIALTAVLVIGSRGILLDGVAPVGQMVPFHDSVRDTLASYGSGWWGAGFGQVSASPTGIALSAVATVSMLGRSGLAHTLAVVLLPLVGWVGVWRFASVLGTRAGRIGAVAAYAAVPLAWVAIAAGRWGALLVYAMLPWAVHLSRMLVGHADVSEARAVESMVTVSQHVRRRWFASLSLVLAVTFAFEPSIVAVFPATVAMLMVAMVLQGVRLRWLGRWIAVTVASVALALVLNLPWAIGYVRDGWWQALFGAPVEGGRGLGLWRLMTFDLGSFWMSAAVVGLYGAVLGAVFLVRGARTQWALRGATLVGVGLLVAIADDSALLPLHAAEPGVMLVPVALGVALCAGAMGASLSTDLGRGRLSWRQPFGALVGAVFVIGLVPTAVNSTQGSWHQPSVTLSQLLAQLPEPDQDGDYRTLFIGDSRVLPGAPLSFGWGISYSVINGRTPAIDEHWELPRTKMMENTLDALYGIVRGQTSRAGRLLGPMSVRFVVVPIIDGAQSTRDRPIPAPLGLVESLSRQLDMKRRFSSPDLVVFENTSWVPVRSVLTAEGAENSKLAGARSMITADIFGATGLPSVDHGDASMTVEVPAGVVHIAAPYTTQWRVVVDGGAVASRPGFGLTNAFDIEQGGTAEISFDTSWLQSTLVVLQFAAWSVVVFVALAGRRRRRIAPVVPVDVDTPVMTLSGPEAGAGR